MQQVFVYRTFLKKNDSANLKSDIDKLHIDELEKNTKWFKYFEK